MPVPERAPGQRWHPGAKRGPLPPRGRGRGDKSLSPTSSQLLASHSRPPGHRLGQSLQGPVRALHRAPRLSCWRPDGWECGTPLPADSRFRSALSSPRVLHPGLHKGAFHAGSAALCAALPARSAAFTHPQHRGPGGDSASCRRDGAAADACGVRTSAASRAADTLLSISSSLSIAIHRRPQRHVPPTVLEGLPTVWMELRRGWQGWSSGHVRA